MTPDSDGKGLPLPPRTDPPFLTATGIGDACESLYPFLDEIIIQDRESATRYAHHILERTPMERYLVIWVDASVHPSPEYRNVARISAAAAVYVEFSSMKWKDSVAVNTLQYGTRFVDEAELIAIQEAFRIASRLTDNFDRLLIFFDAQSVLDSLKAQRSFNWLPKKDVLNDVFRYVNSLYDLGISVELRWCPAHSSI
jgi:ribonuclease HI